MEPKPGDKLGPYEIVSSIGKGGMGEVWKARDTRLNRDVAIKFCSSQFSDRFLREAQAIAALNHPNICTLFDIGPDYLVMEYIEGSPPRGPLPPPEAVRLALGIAAALEAAHAKGITHRDLKPANVLVTQSGLKLLDFGLALVNGHAKAAIADAPTALSVAGAVMGTIAYMSPEQAQGKAADARSDIFAFGLVLYEMLSGRQAFAGDSAIDTMAAIVRDEPAPLDAPPRLCGIISRCLLKAPASRFQAISEVRAALESVMAARTDDAPSIAVLPFANMSADKENEYFSDGLAEEILNALAQIQGLKVIARTSSFAFRGKEQDITKIAETLRVKTILEGSVRRAGSRIRVTAQLIDAADGSHIWSERYDRELTDVFAVQDEIATTIAGMLREKLGSELPRARKYKPELPAYESYLKGQYQFSKYTADGISRSRQLFEQAIRLDPKYVEPRLALVTAEVHAVVNGLRPARDVIPRVRAATHEILALDHANAIAHAILGGIAAYYDYDWEAAGRLFRRAVAEAPQDPFVQWTFVIFYREPVFGHRNEGLEAAAKAVEQDPLSVFRRAMLSHHMNVNGLYDDAAHEANAALEIEDHWLVHEIMAEAYSARGMFKEAVTQAEESYRLAPWHARAQATLAGILIRLGRGDEAARLLKNLDEASPFVMVLYHVLARDIDGAADWFEKSIDQREPFAVMYSPWPILRPLRESPRWPALAKSMNLPESV
jgi:eukaryotic-like serine/threonine-protein kinase